MRSRAAQIAALVEGDRNLRISFESGVGSNQIEEGVLQGRSVFSHKEFSKYDVRIYNFLKNKRITSNKNDYKY